MQGKYCRKLLKLTSFRYYAIKQAQSLNCKVTDRYMKTHLILPFNALSKMVKNSVYSNLSYLLRVNFLLLVGATLYIQLSCIALLVCLFYCI